MIECQCNNCDFEFAVPREWLQRLAGDPDYYLDCPACQTFLKLGQPVMLLPKGD
jgi:hypothetical protein